MVEDDSSDDEGPVLRDGTIEASVRNPKPLRELLPHRTSAVEPARPVQPASTPQGPVAPAKAGPSRPLPPTPDDEDTMRRGARLMDSPGQGPHQHPPRTNMPDLLPQTPTSSASPGSGRPQGLGMFQEQGSPGLGQSLQEKQKSFLSFGFGVDRQGGATEPVIDRHIKDKSLYQLFQVGSVVPRRESHINVNVTPQHDYGADTPEIRKYKKRFNSEILCAALWGVNLLIGTENGLMLLDRWSIDLLYHDIRIYLENMVLLYYV